MDTYITTLIGIDYGSKLAGTTVIAELNFNSNLPSSVPTLFQVKKGKDTDDFILHYFQKYQDTNCNHRLIIALDAPLTLPRVYRETTPLPAADFFYRTADRTLRAMSPMFLGGLTARAIRLAATIRAAYSFASLFECYPAVHAQRLDLKTLGYKKALENVAVVVDFLATQLPFALPGVPVRSWHEIDALLALWSAYRYYHYQHETFGDEDEGVIIV